MSLFLVAVSSLGIAKSYAHISTVTEPKKLSVEQMNEIRNSINTISTKFGVFERVTSVPLNYSPSEGVHDEELINFNTKVLILNYGVFVIKNSVK
ncbi:hypothetical protein [Paenibacillus sp. N3.4]|uniref:hypothetical protein n=1 Tax=Paenibacillus sp. N3.4 TaxID=2603222 RepID=UPI00164FD704|nr:hypothetical protein [Paenibacillus sp. N3.4]